MTLTTTPAVDHVAGRVGEYLYPGAGDPRPPGGAMVHLLTKGGICIRGTWSDDGSVIGWCPLPVRNSTKEALLCNA
jgi:hypothetical protein